MDKGKVSSGSPVRVAVTGSAGQVGYALLFRIASGQLLGPTTPVALRLLDIEAALPALEGTAMELEDCAFPLLASVEITADPVHAFQGVSWALMVGAMPRREGMERGDLLAQNGRLFAPQGRAIAAAAASDVRVLVVGNPCNTNCLIARASAPEVPAERWFAMTRLDENRARAQLAGKAGAPVGSVTNLAIWGNHSSTQYPDAIHARIGGRPVPEVIADHDWLRDAFVATVQQRGAAIIAARKLSSAGSAASAIIDTVGSIRGGTLAGDWTSVGVVSRGEYGVPDGLQFSLPVIFNGGAWTVVDGIDHDAEARRRLDLTIQELVEERSLVGELLGG